MAVAVVGVADLLRDFGLSTAAIQAEELSKEQHSNLFWINSLFGLGCGIAVFICSFPIAAFFEQPELVAVIQILAVTFFLGGVATQFKVQINRQLRFGRLAVIEVAGAADGFPVRPGLVVRHQDVLGDRGAVVGHRCRRSGVEHSAERLVAGPAQAVR